MDRTINRRIWLPLLLLAALLVACRDGQTPTPGPTATPTPPRPIFKPPTPPPTAGPSANFQLLMPLAVGDPGAAASPAAGPPAATPTPDYPLYAGPPLDRDRRGIQIHLHREDLGQILGHLEALDVGWVKVQIEWKVYEPRPGEYDAFRLGELDRLVGAANEAGIRVLLGVAKAPDWSRPTTEQDGPPQDPAAYQAFMGYLAGRYAGRVTAYELWNEPNLQREWIGAPLSAVDFVALLRAGAAGVRAANPQAILVSGAPATTGIDDGVTAIDDRAFLRQMLAAGAADVVDAIGAHPYGWANPPDSTAAAPDPASPSHNNHPSFFFLDTLRDYRALLEEAGRPDLPIWVTEFGWGTYDGFDAPPPAGLEYLGAVSEWQQAVYTLRAFELAAGEVDLGPLILWNLNVAPTFGAAYPESAYSLLGLDGEPRPAYRALASMARPEQSPSRSPGRSQP